MNTSSNSFAGSLDMQLIAVVIGITALGAVMVGTTAISCMSRLPAKFLLDVFMKRGPALHQ